MPDANCLKNNVSSVFSLNNNQLNKNSYNISSPIFEKSNLNKEFEELNYQLSSYKKSFNNNNNKDSLQYNTDNKNNTNSHVDKTTFFNNNTVFSKDSDLGNVDELAINKIDLYNTIDTPIKVNKSNDQMSVGNSMFNLYKYNSAERNKNNTCTISSVENNLNKNSLSNTKLKSLRIAEITEKLQGFEKAVGEKTSMQLKNENNRIQQYKEKIESLESLLNQTIKDRIDTQKSMYVDIEQKINQAYTKLENYFIDRSNEYSDAINTIHNDFKSLELRLIDIQNDDMTKEIWNGLNSCKESIETLKESVPKLFQNISSQILDKIQSIETSLQSQLENEIIRQNRKFEGLVENAESFKYSLNASKEAFQLDVFDKISKLRTLLENEKKAREEGDELIVVSLNQYTAALDEAIRRNYEDNQ